MTAGPWAVARELGCARGGELAPLFELETPSSSFWIPACGGQTAVGHLPCAEYLQRSRVQTRSSGSLQPGGWRKVCLWKNRCVRILTGMQDAEHSGRPGQPWVWDWSGLNPGFVSYHLRKLGQLMSDSVSLPVKWEHLPCRAVTSDEIVHVR